MMGIFDSSEMLSQTFAFRLTLMSFRLTIAIVGGFLSALLMFPIIRWYQHGIRDAPISRMLSRIATNIPILLAASWIPGLVEGVVVPSPNTAENTRST